MDSSPSQSSTAADLATALERLASEAELSALGHEADTITRQASQLPQALGPGGLEEDLAKAAHAVGRLAYAVARDASAPEAGFAEILSWQERLNRAVRDAGHSLRVRLIHPGEPYDMECMESVRSTTGHRLQVEEPLSWIVLRRLPGEEPAVLLRGQVVTR